MSVTKIKAGKCSLWVKVRLQTGVRARVRLGKGLWQSPSFDGQSIASVKDSVWGWPGARAQL